MRGDSRLAALVRKESLQVVRDPSAILIAFALPVLLLFLFAFAVSLDIKKLPIGVVLETDGDAAQSLAAAFANSQSFAVTPTRDRRVVAPAVAAGRLRGFIVIPSDFEQRLASRGQVPIVQVIADGSQPNTAGFLGNYAQGVVGEWQLGRNLPRPPGVELQPRVWFNQVIESRWFLVPGAIAIIMTMIGTLLTALVVAREWERGTMEAMLSTPARIVEILAGKMIPYFVLGLVATFLSALVAVYAFGVPLRGSWGALLALATAFMVPALGQGLLISAVARNQFVAAQLALFSGFLPALLLSGFLFEIDAMPLPIRIITYVVPARYFTSSLQTVFLAGDVWSLFLPNMLAMVAIGGFFFAVARAKTRRSLD